MTAADPKWRQWLPHFLILGLMITAAVYVGWRSSRPVASNSAIDPAEPITVPVTRGDVTLLVLTPGELIATRERVLSLDSGGRLESITARAGTVVAGGDPIAALADGITTLTAPFAGVVAELFVRPGEQIDPGQPLALIVDPAALEVRVTVIEEDLPLVQVGQAAEIFFDAAPDFSAAGTVVRIVPIRVPFEDRPLYHVYLSLGETPATLLPGMTADAAITVATTQAVLRLPRGVLRVGADGRAQAQRLQNGVIETITVQTGQRGNAFIEIIDGLAEGDLIVGE